MFGANNLEPSQRVAFVRACTGWVRFATFLSLLRFPGCLSTYAETLCRRALQNSFHSNKPGFKPNFVHEN